ncbi:MAG: hypothetical protein LBC88_03825 [Spirochaetaceae bacterium]|nr:hypothetical protein [Spirochaetaceae bacterium]
MKNLFHLRGIWGIIFLFFASAVAAGAGNAEDASVLVEEYGETAEAPPDPSAVEPLPAGVPDAAPVPPPPEPAPQFAPPLASAHRGKITALAAVGDGLVISAGEDGFIGLWDTRRMTAVERFQIGPWPIVSLSVRPARPEIALSESDGLGMYRVSVWNYREKRQLFSLRFRDPVSFAGWSAAGGFLIVAPSGTAGALFIRPETGETFASPDALAAHVSFAVTGSSERNMLVYSPSGTVSYWDLAGGVEARRFSAPVNLISPLLFGNNRFFAGFDRRGLVILDAASWREVARHNGLARGTLIAAPGDGAEFFCIAPSARGAVWYHFAVTASGALSVRRETALPAGLSPSCAAWVRAPDNDPASLVLGGNDGAIRLVTEAGGVSAAAVEHQTRIRSAAQARDALVFITQTGRAGTIARDYAAFRDGTPLVLYDAGSYRFVAGSEAGFVFWQNERTAPAPVVKENPAVRGRSLDRPPGNAPLRAVSLLGNQALLLDAAGALAAVSLETGRSVFGFSSAGAIDAAFLDGRTIIIARSSAAGGTPFLKVNIRTGETVPLAWPSRPAPPAEAGLGLYRARGGAFYAAAIEAGEDGAKTSLIALDAENPARSRRLAVFPEEAGSFARTETAGVFAATLGGDGAFLCTDGTIRPFERGPALPVELLDGENAFIILDGEGNFSWHDTASGTLIALFRIRGDVWELFVRAGERFLSGPVESP